MDDWIGLVGAVTGGVGMVIGGLALYVSYLGHKSQKQSQEQIDFLDVKTIIMPIHYS